MAAWQFAKALDTAERKRMASIRHDAEPLQSGLSRGRARDESALHRQGVGLIPWSPLARGFLAGNREKDGTEPTARAKTDDFAKNMYFRE